MTQLQEPSGDYGYDLVHEGEGAFSRWSAGPAAPQPYAGGPTVAATDPGGDYGYDEAHDL